MPSRPWTGVVGSIVLLVPVAAAAQAPALRTPPPLPTDPAAFDTRGLRVDVVLQVRAEIPFDTVPSSFTLRKAEVGIKGHVADRADFSIELDPVNPDEPFRRTYVRLSHLRRLHVKLGLEKAPLGLQELLSTAEQPLLGRSEVSDRFAAAEELGLHLESTWRHWLLQFSVTNGGRRLLRDDNDHKDVWARVVWGPAPWASIGIAASDGRTGAEGLDRRRYNVETKLGSMLSGAQGEVYRAKDADVWSSAYYAEAYWAFPMRLDWLTHVQPGVRLEQIVRSDHVRALEQSRLTVGLSVLLDEHRSKLQISYLHDLRAGFGDDRLRTQYQVQF